MIPTPAPRTRRPRALLPLLLPLAPLAGCDGSAAPDGPVPIEIVRTLDGAPPRLDVGSATRFGARSPFRYAVPAGWTEVPPASNLRLLDFRAGASTECFLSRAGGGALDNVNRWRAQMGVAALDSAGLDALPRAALFEREALLVELAGSFTGPGPDGQTQSRPGQRMLALFTEPPVGAISLKMVGPDAEVAAQRDAFLAFARDLAFEGGSAARAGANAPAAQPAAEPAAAAQSSPEGALAWTLPGGWRESDGSAMRLVTFAVDGRANTECWITLLSGSAGGLLANLNRWRGEVGAAPLDEAQVAALPTVDVLGRKAPLLEVEGTYRGMSGTLDGAMLLGIVATHGDASVFVKMVGPAADVRAERDRFVALCESLK